MRSAFILLCVGLAAVTISCSPKAPTLTLDGSATDNPTVEAIFRRSCDSFKRGDLGVADEGFARIVREFPEDPLVRSSIIYRARIAVKLDNPKRARALLAPIKGTRDAVAERATLYDGQALFQLGETQESIRVLLPLVDRMTDQEDIGVLETTLWYAARKENNLELAAASVGRLLLNLSDAGERRDVLYAFKKMLVPIGDVDYLAKSPRPFRKTVKFKRQSREEWPKSIWMPVDLIRRRPSWTDWTKIKRTDPRLWNPRSERLRKRWPQKLSVSLSPSPAGSVSSGMRRSRGPLWAPKKRGFVWSSKTRKTHRRRPLSAWRHWSVRIAWRR